MRLAWRIAAGPKRAPGRLEVPRSNGMPAMQIAASVFVRSRPRKLGLVANVGIDAMASIWGPHHLGWRRVPSSTSGKGLHHPGLHLGLAVGPLRSSGYLSNP